MLWLHWIYFPSAKMKLSTSHLERLCLPLGAGGGIGKGWKTTPAKLNPGSG